MKEMNHRDDETNDPTWSEETNTSDSEMDMESGIDDANCDNCDTVEEFCALHPKGKACRICRKRSKHGRRTREEEDSPLEGEEDREIQPENPAPRKRKGRS